MKYDAIIKDQLSQGIVERVQDESKGKEFYIPHTSQLFVKPQKVPKPELCMMPPLIPTTNHLP